MQSQPPRSSDAAGDQGNASNTPAAAQTGVAARPTLWKALSSAFASWWGTAGADKRSETSDELAEDRTDMAATRTLMAADRTLMAWVRTSLSLSSFGFTVYKLLHALNEAGITLRPGQTPRDVGLFLTAVGTLAMVMGTVQYAQALRELRRYMDIRVARPVLIMALLMTGLGLFLFFSIAIRL